LKPQHITWIRHFKLQFKPIVEMSFIHYKFRAAKAHDSLVVDGMGMSTFDLKREVVRQKKLKGEDFDLVLTNAESGEGKGLLLQAKPIFFVSHTW
jgi:hypothetical protein